MYFVVAASRIRDFRFWDLGGVRRDRAEIEERFCAKLGSDSGIVTNNTSSDQVRYQSNAGCWSSPYKL